MVSASGARHDAQPQRAGSFARDSATVLGTRLAVVALAMVSGAVLARLLGPTGKGILASILIVPTLFCALAEMGVRQAVVYHLGKRTHTDAEIVSCMLFLLLASSVVGMLVCLVYLASVPKAGYTAAMIGVALLTVPSRTAISYAGGVFLGKGQIGLLNRVAWQSELLKLVAIGVLVYACGLGVVGALGAAALGVGLTAARALQLVGRVAPLRIRYDAQMVKELLCMGGVYAAALYVLRLNHSFDLILMQRLTTPAEIGQYSNAVAVSDMLLYLPQAMGTVLFSRSARNAGEDAGFALKVGALLRVQLVIASAGAIAFALAMPVVIPLVYGHAFAPSVRALQILLPGVVGWCTLHVLLIDLAGKGAPGSTLWATVPALALSVGLDLAWIPRHGANGAALAATISYALAALLLLSIYSRKVGVPVAVLLRFRREDFRFLRWRRRTTTSGSEGKGVAGDGNAPRDDVDGPGSVAFADPTPGNGAPL